MRKRLEVVYSQVYDKVQEALKELDSVTLTTDNWTSRALDSNMALTA